MKRIDTFKVCEFKTIAVSILPDQIKLFHSLQSKQKNDFPELVDKLIKANNARMGL